jgi:hypothetical protein
MAAKLISICATLCLLAIAIGCVELAVEIEKPPISQNAEDYGFSDAALTPGERALLKSSESGAKSPPAVSYRPALRSGSSRDAAQLPASNPARQAAPEFDDPVQSEGRPLAILPPGESMAPEKAKPKTNYFVSGFPSDTEPPPLQRPAPVSSPEINRPAPPAPGERYLPLPPPPPGEQISPFPTPAPIPDTGRAAHGNPLKDLDSLLPETSYVPPPPPPGPDGR